MKNPKDNPVAESASAHVSSSNLPGTSPDGGHIETGKTADKASPSRENHIVDHKITTGQKIFLLFATLAPLAYLGSRDLSNHAGEHRSNLASDDLAGLEGSIAKFAAMKQEENLSGMDEVFLTGLTLGKVNDIAKRSPTPKKRLLAAHTDDEETSAGIRRAVAEMRSKPMDDKTLIARCIIMIDLCMREMKLSEEKTGFSTDVRNKLLTDGLQGVYPETGAMAKYLALLLSVMNTKDSVELEKAVREKLGELDMKFDEEMFADLMLRLEEELSLMKLRNRQNDAAEASTRDVASR